jgi:hypothetical protein
LPPAYHRAPPNIGVDARMPMTPITANGSRAAFAATLASRPGVPQIADDLLQRQSRQRRARSGHHHETSCFKSLNWLPPIIRRLFRVQRACQQWSRRRQSLFRFVPESDLPLDFKT